MFGDCGFSAAAGAGDEDPCVAVALFTGECRGVNLRRIEMVVAGERWDEFTAAGAGLEFPSVIAAGDALAVEPAFAEGNAAMRAAIAHRKNGTIVATTQHEWNAEQHGFGQFVFAQRVCAQSGVPVVIEERGAWALDGNARLCCGDEWHFASP
jgi:hypothetical protein